MGGFFNLDGPFAKFGNMVADVLILSFLWLIFCLPVVTAGAATTALFYVTTRRISDREGYLFRDFWKSFRQNFKQSTICWVILLLLTAILYVNITNIDILGSAQVFILPLQVCIALELAFISLYVFPLLARFELSVKDVFQNAFFMANRHLFTTLALLALMLTVILLSYTTIIFSLVAAGSYAFASSYLLMRVFRKYRPEIDRDEEFTEIP